jgi:hypothetical protein
MEFGGREVLGRIVDDLGPIGVRGRRLFRIEAYLAPELETLDVPEEELRPQRCLGHRNGFHHFDPGSAPLEPYDLGIKRRGRACRGSGGRRRLRALPAIWLRVVSAMKSWDRPE